MNLEHSSFIQSNPASSSTHRPHYKQKALTGHLPCSRDYSKYFICADLFHPHKSDDKVSVDITSLQRTGTHMAPIPRGPFPSMVCRTCVFLLASGIWQRGWDVLITWYCNLSGVSLSIFGFEQVRPLSSTGDEFCQNLRQLGSELSPVEPPDENPAMANTLTVTLQRNQLSHAWTPDPSKLWDNKCVLFEATKLETLLCSNRWWTHPFYMWG